MKPFAAAAGKAIDALGPAALHAIADGIETGGLSGALAVPGFAEAKHAIRTEKSDSGLPDDVAVAYLRGVADGYARSSAAETVESVWSGPSSHAVPLRSTAQVLIEVSGEAQDELILMTYSARPHPPLIEALCTARVRGVRVSVVVETLQGAGGALSGIEPAAAFRHVPGVLLWHWPSTARRKPGSHMHAKIAVADRRVLLVSSANLTQSAAESNIEAGLLVRGGIAPRRAAEHVEHLMGAGVLARLHPSG